MKKFVIAVVIIVLVVAAGGACFWYFSQKTKDTKDAETTNY